MKPFFCLLSIIGVSWFSPLAAQKTDAHIIGHVVAGGEHVPNANVYLKGTTIGAATDGTGHFQMLNLPLGEYTIVARVIGYKPAERKVKVELGRTVEIKFELEEDVLQLEGIVVTGDRNAVNRVNSPVIVTALAPRVFFNTHSTAVSEGLNYCPGLRVESNCQNCGFTQLRMNGMEGPYSQILINGRPIFNGLAGVYGLEMIPNNMVERIEVVRGAGSALYGSNAVAGTVNLILKDPIRNQFEADVSNSSIAIGTRSAVPLQSVNLNAAVVTNDQKAGLVVYGAYHDRGGYDANNDGFSELSQMRNKSLGARLFHRVDSRGKLSADIFVIDEKRRGGDRFDYPLHQSGIAEAVQHNITSTALTFERYYRKQDLLSLFGTVMNIDRDSYYGANQALDAYGKTFSSAMSLGGTYAAAFGSSNALLGWEFNRETLNDKKLSYPNIDKAYFDGEKLVIPQVDNTVVADQNLSVAGVFAQYDLQLNRLKIALGLRFDHFSIANPVDDQSVTGDVVSPRLNFLYNVLSSLQLRAGYARGYRAPQIFDEDLHVETSGARQVRHVNEPDLRQENSSSYTTSLNYHTAAAGVNVEILAEAFYTMLENPFVNEFGTPDEEGVVVYTRRNAENGAVVRGMNWELNLITNNSLNLKFGYTLQSSRYTDPQKFGERRFFRTPDDYGFLNASWQVGVYDLSLTCVYTGRMLTPYFGVRLDDPETGALVRSPRFFDMGVKIAGTINVNGTNTQVYVGVKNLFNSFQKDFDIGIDRDPGYVYGPLMPRTVYAGLRIFSR